MDDNSNKSDSKTFANSSDPEQKPNYRESVQEILQARPTLTREEVELELETHGF